MKLCTIDGCGKPLRARRLCEMHLARLYRTGSTDKRTRGPATPREARERALKAAYTRQWEARKAAGYEHRMDGRPVRKHVQRLLDAGATYTSIAETAGVAINSVRRVHQGTVRRPQTPTAEAILAVDESRSEHVISEVEHLIGWRRPDEIATAVGYMNVGSLSKTLYRWGRPDLAAHFNRVAEWERAA